MILFHKPTLRGDQYAGLVTAFAVIIAVEYSSGTFDTWDILLGIVSGILGYSYIDEAKKLNDYWYSFLTAGLISLGVISVLNAAVFLFSELLSWGLVEPQGGPAAFFYDAGRLFLFLVGIVAVQKYWKFEWTENT